jgi:hypothetical protein
MRDKVCRLLAGLFRFPMKRELGSHSAVFVILNRGGDSSVSHATVAQTICPFWVQRRRKVAAALDRIAHAHPELALERRGV